MAPSDTGRHQKSKRLLTVFLTFTLAAFRLSRALRGVCVCVCAFLDPCSCSCRAPTSRLASPFFTFSLLSLLSLPSFSFVSLGSFTLASLVSFSLVSFSLLSLELACHSFSASVLAQGNASLFGVLFSRVLDLCRNATLKRHPNGLGTAR